MKSIITKVVVSVVVSVVATAAVNYINKKSGRGHLKSTVTYLQF